MAALLQASAALPGTTVVSKSTFKSPLQFRSVSCFTGTNLRWNPKSLKPLIVRGHPGVARASSPDTIIEDICQVGDHFLDSASNFVLKQIRKPMAKYLPDDWDPLHFLPVNIHSKFHKSEALATLVLREMIVLAWFYLVYHGVDGFCRWTYGLYTRKRGNGKEIDDDAYAVSPFRAARTPIRSFVLIWASTRLLWTAAVLWKMQAVITEEIVYNIRASGLVIMITWFLFRWKGIYVKGLVERKVLDEGQILTFDKIVSLAMYVLAASCIAEVLGFTLNSLIAVGGVSGVAVALAGQVIVENMFGGASLFITRPFVVGEKIKAGEVSGLVKDIGFMQTKVTGFDGVPVYVPNNAFTSQVITNFSRAKTKVLEASMQLNNRHIFLVHTITEKVQSYLVSHPSVESVKATPICYLKSMESDGPVIALSCVIKSSGGASYYTIQQEILIHVARIITDKLGNDSPFTPLTVPSTDEKTVNTQQKLVL